MDEATLKTIKATLESQLEAAQRHLEQYGDATNGEALDVSVDEGFADSAAVTSERSELLAQLEQGHAARDEIIEALRRIDEGSFGKCETCGADIPAERLEAIPTARLCVSCKQAESSG